MNPCTCTHAPEQHGSRGCLIVRIGGDECPCIATPEDMRAMRDMPDVTFPLSADEARIAWAATAAMVADIHAPQDQLTSAEWKTAEALHDRLSDFIETLEKKS